MKPPLTAKVCDDFQTPKEALLPLIPYLKKDWVIWECAKGKGNLSDFLREKGFYVLATDISDSFDFLTYEPDSYDCIITNPPFSLKQEFLLRAYELKKPFAFLLPLTTLETPKRQYLFNHFGVEIILFDRRISFEVPSGMNSQNKSWFATAWFTNWLNIGRQLTFVNYFTKLYEKGLNVSA